MILISGAYRLAKTTVAYRADWCNHCDKEVVAFGTRCFLLGHLYWIPLLPLGYRTFWHCAECTCDPRAVTRTRPGFLIAGALTITIVAVFTILAPATGKDAGLIWLLRAVFTLLAILTWYLLVRRLRRPVAVREVRPLDNANCLLCAGAMDLGPITRCTTCGVERLGGAAVPG